MHRNPIIFLPWEYRAMSVRSSLSVSKGLAQQADTPSARAWHLCFLLPWKSWKQNLCRLFLPCLLSVPKTESSECAAGVRQGPRVGFLYLAWVQKGTKAIPGKRKASPQACECPSCAGGRAARSRTPTRRSCTWLEEEEEEQIRLKTRPQSSSWLVAFPVTSVTPFSIV